ncbi:MAG: ferric iron uptake transcriptional regulator [Gammaproteobacteria bacterium]|nr:ferric iron uptake transcriptional regulator [Gammaproteobacteria bacterium]HBF07589.1 ferric iron uptake transcriptional regulator [Gammaproteobacteria bacterium]|tara:strand:- start:13 stop:438 length:426 start_codon:yes stop_codon:yes gene_type:complete
MDEDQLKAAGLKVTTPRMRILTLLGELDQPHVSAEQVYQTLRDAGEDIGLATVYRVLTQFEQAGIVEKHFFSGNQAVFELADNDHHDHLLCLECGKVVEFTNEVIENEQEKIAKKFGFELKEHTLTLYGHCKQKDCPSGQK